MRRTVWLVGLAALGLIAAGQGGCSGDGGNGGNGGSAAGDGTGPVSYDGGSDGSDGIGIDPSCSSCACDYKTTDSPSGCADICDNTLSGTPNPNFCNGASALSMCAACIEERCGESAATCE